MTHVVRELERPGSRLNKKEVVEGVTILEAPPMICVGMVGYVKTTRGLKTLTVAWANHLSENVKKRVDKKNHFSKVRDQEANIKAIKENCTVVRAVMHSQPE